MSSRFSSLLLIALAISPRLAAAARVDRLLPGRIDAVIAVAGGAVVLRDGTAVFVDDDGRVRGRCAGDAPAPTPTRERARARLDPADAEDALRLAGLPDDDDGSPEAEDALEDEGLGPGRRARVAPAVPIALARGVAATSAGDAVWIATTDGLLWARADGSGCDRRAFAGREVALVAAAADVVVAVAGDAVWRSADGGATFDAVAALPARPRAVALTGDGAHALIATDDGVFEPAGARALGRVLDRAADALAACGEALLVLAGDTTYAWTPTAGAVRVGPRPPARGLACALPPGAAARAVPRWAAAGAGLWTSDDGATWTDRRATAGLSLAAAAPARAGWWLAADDGLLREDAGAEPPRAAGAWAAAALPPGGAASRAAAVWAAPLPRVSVAFGARAEAGTRAEWHVWLLLALPLGRTPRGVADAVDVRARVAARRAALAREELGWRAAAPGDDEAAAWARALADEREALR